MELKIKERVLAAAEKSSYAKELMKEIFPEAFENEYYDFGERFVIDCLPRGPLFIANKYAKNEDRHKVLLVNRKYRVCVTPEYNGTEYTAIQLKRDIYV